jgi:hypothetical protein
VRRDGERVLVALSHELAGYAFRLGDLADRIAGEDPLVPPQRVIQRLREVAAPNGLVPLPDSRLVRLAAAASSGAGPSSRQELYPRGMEAGRALKLSQGALYGVSTLTVQEIHGSGVAIPKPRRCRTSPRSTDSYARPDSSSAGNPRSKASAGKCRGSATPFRSRA